MAQWAVRAPSPPASSTLHRAGRWRVPSPARPCSGSRRGSPRGKLCTVDGDTSTACSWQWHRRAAWPNRKKTHPKMQKATGFLPSASPPSQPGSPTQPLFQQIPWRAVLTQLCGGGSPLRRGFPCPRHVPGVSPGPPLRADPALSAGTAGCFRPLCFGSGAPSLSLRSPRGSTGPHQ